MKIKPTCLMFLVGVGLSFAFPLLANDKNETDEEGAVKKELEKLEAEWAVAVETNDPKRIGPFFAIDFLFVGAGGILQDRMQHLEDFRSGKLHIDSVKIGDKTIHVYKDAAVVSSRVMVKGKIKVESEYKSIDGSYQFTDTWVRQGGRWLAVVRQQTAIRSPENGSR